MDHMMDHNMIPYFHSTPGIALWFKEWTPSSAGGIVGACFVLFFFALFERFISAVRGVCERHWQARALLLSNKCSPSTYETRTSPVSKVPSSQEEGVVEVHEVPATVPSVVPRVNSRTIPPFLTGHDIPRGLLHGFQAMLSYALMLAVMTYRVDFVLCIVVGSGVGEILFGRAGGGVGGH